MTEPCLEYFKNILLYLKLQTVLKFEMPVLELELKLMQNIFEDFLIMPVESEEQMLQFYQNRSLLIQLHLYL